MLIAERSVETGVDAEPAIANSYTSTETPFGSTQPTSEIATASRCCLLQARSARDEVARDRALKLADDVLTFMESATPGSGALARAEWYRLKALHTADRATAIRDIDRADSVIEMFIQRLYYKYGEAWLLRGRLARLRCRLSPSSCDPSRADEYFRQALALTPNLRAEVARAGAE